MQVLKGIVNYRTTIGDRYKICAAPSSMEAYLKDWKAAHARLGRKIEELEAMYEERKEAADAGEWP